MGSGAGDGAAPMTGGARARTVMARSPARARKPPAPPPPVPGARDDDVPWLPAGDLHDRGRWLNPGTAWGEDGRYVLVWLQQALRARDNPVIDAGLALANPRRLPVLVYHGVRPDYPWASDRLHHALLGASRSLQAGVRARGIACVTHVERPGKAVRGLVHQLTARAAAVVTDDQPVFVARAQAAAVAARAVVPVIAVDAARLVPSRMLVGTIGSTPDFRAAHGALRAAYATPADVDLPAAVPPWSGPLPVDDDRLADRSDGWIAEIIAACPIDHSLPPATWFDATEAAGQARLEAFCADALAGYPFARNTPADPRGASMLSPWLHFGVMGPRRLAAAVAASGAAANARWKFLDEALTWREWFHWLAGRNPGFHRFDALPMRPRDSLDAHAGDPRETLYGLPALLAGETGDETWNAAQRQFVEMGYMHNNLRMYWGKRLIGWTPTARHAWAAAAWLNDRLSLDGRDPATYGNLQWCFGRAKPAFRDQPVYGIVTQKTDRALRERPGMPAWLAATAGRRTVTPAVDAHWDGLLARYDAGTEPLL